MRPVLVSTIASWCEGRHLGADVEIRRVSTDSRTITSGDLFVALRGENFDGHDYVAQAQANGAAALLLQHDVASDLPRVLCADSQEALGELAAGVQKNRSTVVIGVIGSNGKTSVKMLTHGILSRTGTATLNPGNRNNEIGLPLAVLDAPEDAQFAVYEMGAGKPGDIAYLASIAPPQVALVNNIAPAHIERMGSLLGIAETKAAIYEALSDDGVAVINADDAFAVFFRKIVGSRRCFRFGIDNDADVYATQIIVGAQDSRFMLHTPAGNSNIVLPLPGRHNIMNALAATALALAAGAALSAIIDGLQHAEAVKGRQIAHQLGSGAILIDDSYNANPGSVSAAIAALTSAAQLDVALDTWLVLGDMAELGEDAASLHAAVGEQARRAGVKKLWTVGRLSRAASVAFGDTGRHFDNQDALIASLSAELQCGDRSKNVRCLIKGSRSSAMDRVVRILVDADRQRSSGHAA